MSRPPITHVTAFSLQRLLLYGVLLFTSYLLKGQIPVEPSPPRPYQIAPLPSILNTPKGEQKPATGLPGNPFPFQQQLDQATFPGGADQIKQQSMVQLEQMLQKEYNEMYKKYADKLAATKSYMDAFKDLGHLNPDSFSLTRAEYDIENAYLNNKFSYNQFLNAVRRKADQVKQLLKREGLKTNNLTLNYGIQQLYRRSIPYYDSGRKQIITTPPFTYDFQDYNGEKDIRNLFTEKLLRTGKGQCLSMPRLYLMIAGELKAKAWLSLAPQHTYIQFVGDGGNLRNFETTNGNIVSIQWLAHSGFITAKALKNGLYLDTLTQRQLYAQCLADLLYVYLQNYEYDEFAEQVKQRALQVDPNNLRALMIDAIHKRDIAFKKIIEAGKPKPPDLPHFPEAYQAYMAMKMAIDKVDELGFQDMPPDAYQKWLHSIEQEKKQQANKEVNERIQREIDHYKRTRSTLIIKSSKQ